MEEYFFQYYSQGDEDLWLDQVLPLPAVNDQYYRSSFVKYSNQPLQGFGSNGWENHEKNDRNAHKRMIKFLKERWKLPMTIAPMEVERQRSHKHTINERMRRERQKQCFVALHKMLPCGTKGDKNSIVQMAAERLQELQRCKEELKRRKIELESALAAASNRDDEGNLEEAKIKLRVAHPSSGIDSMLEVLKCLKNTGTKAKAIQSEFSSQEFSAVLQIEAKIGATEVEKAVHETLFEVEKKFRRPF